MLLFVCREKCSGTGFRSGSKADIVSVTIDQDDEHYLLKTPYHYEIRMKGSTTWVTYIMYRGIPFDQCVLRLSRKYIDLVANCRDPNHFDGQIEFAV